MPNKYIGKIITSKDGIKGKCVGYLPKTRELAIMHNKGGRIVYVRKEDIDNAR